jgi:hypothetical protein
MHIDPMERGMGGRHPRGKVKRAAEALGELRRLRVIIATHDLFGPVDVVAEHPGKGTRLIEVEGESGRQREQALYSSLGQHLLSRRFGVITWRTGLQYRIQGSGGGSCRRYLSS